MTVKIRTNRKNVTFRFRVETIERLNKLLEKSQDVINPKISRTDILESLVLNAVANCTNTDIKKILLSLGKTKNVA